MWQRYFRAHQQINSSRRANHRIRRTARFHNFREALDFVREVGELAEAEGHHPALAFPKKSANFAVQSREGHACYAVAEMQLSLLE